MTEWFDEHVDQQTGRPGLRFGCTMCGNCCTGPEGFVLVNDAEVEALSRRLGIGPPEFIERFTHITSKGRSLTERLTSHGNDCVFLDREKFPGKAACGVYEDRPGQCRTWPFWNSVLQSRAHWERARQLCPGIGSGTLVSPDQIRIRRRVVDI